MEPAPPPEVAAEQARQALERALSEVRTDADAEALVQKLHAHAAVRTVDVVPVKDDAARARRAAAIARAVHAVRDHDRSAPEIFAVAARELAAAMPRELLQLSLRAQRGGVRGGHAAASPYPRWTGAFYLSAVLVGLSRVYLGAHYPGDVVTGGIGGTILAETSHALLARPSRGWAGRVYKVLNVLRSLARSGRGNDFPRREAPSVFPSPF